MATNKETVDDWRGRRARLGEVHFAFTSAELLRDSPWARTYRLVNDDEPAYLKVLPDHQAAIVPPTVLLSEHFHRHVPKIIAHDVGSGWMLSADHGGRNLRYDSPEEALRKLLETYARFEVEALALPELLASLRQTDLAALPAALLDFLEPKKTDAGDQAGLVGAAYFIGRSEAKRYFRTLSRRRALLERHLEPAAALPLTLNHGDLRPPNAAITSERRLRAVRLG